MRRRILTLGHSYCVALNRRLPTEISRIGGDQWNVTVAAPAFFHGDLQPIITERAAWELASLESIPAYLTRWPHLFFYGSRLHELLRDSFDIVHCWEEPYVVAGWQAARWSAQQSRLIYWTGQTRAKKYPPPFAQIDRFCFRRCDGWLSRGQLGIDAMRERGHGDKPFDAIGLGVDPDLFRPDREAGAAVKRKLGWSDADTPVIGYTGRFVKEKGIGILTAALDRISSPWRAVFLGGGPMREHLEHWASRHGDRVRIVSAVDHEAVPNYINAFDILCAPSLTTSGWREIFGRMVIEAFACRVPVVASDSGELPNVVGNAGLIVREGDVGAWTQALQKLLSLKEMRDELGARGLEKVNQHFTWSAVARKHLEFFERVLTTRRSH